MEQTYRARVILPVLTVVILLPRVRAVARFSFSPQQNNSRQEVAMTGNAQTACPICEEAFEAGEYLIYYREWPGEQQLGHFGCVATLALEDEADDED
jgi:hypothetical protein